MGIAYSILFYSYIIPIILSGLFWSIVGYDELYPLAFLQILCAVVGIVLRFIWKKTVKIKNENYYFCFALLACLWLFATLPGTLPIFMYVGYYFFNSIIHFFVLFVISAIWLMVRGAGIKERILLFFLNPTLYIVINIFSFSTGIVDGSRWP